MARPRRAIMPLEAEATATRTDSEAPALALASPVAAVEIEPDPTPPQRTPARQRLADALDAVKALEAENREVEAELSKIADARLVAFRSLNDAEAQLKRAKPAEAPFSPYGTPLRSYWGTQEEADRAAVVEATPPMSIAEAKALVAAAQDEYDSVKRLEQHWRARGDKIGQDLSWRRRTNSEVRDVLRTDAALHALAAECKRAATASAAANRAFNIATSGDTIQPDSPFYRCTEPTDFREDAEGWVLLHRWRAALEALCSDPDAPLPMPSVA